MHERAALGTSRCKDAEGAGYPASFDTEGSHDLTRVARFDSYPGFLFGSVQADVASPRCSRGTPEARTEQERAWFRAHVDQTLGSSLLGRYGTLDEQAAAILFLASDEASYITGTILPVSGGDPGLTSQACRSRVHGPYCQGSCTRTTSSPRPRPRPH